MNNITKIGNLKDITLNADKNNFSTVSEKCSTISLSLEDYYGNTVQGFLLDTTADREVYIRDTYYSKDNISKELSDYGVKTEYQDGNIVVHYLDRVLDVADVTGDYLFEDDYPELTDLTCIRLQLSNINLYEVVIAKTETKSGRIYVYATSEDEAENIVYRDLAEHLDILDDTKALSCVNYEEEINSISISDINPENYHTFIENGVIYEKGIIDSDETNEDIDINSNRDFLLNHLKELQADFEDLSDDEIIENRECILSRINECLKELLESDKDNL